MLQWVKGRPRASGRFLAVSTTPPADDSTANAHRWRTAAGLAHFLRPPHQPLKLAALLVGEPPDLHAFSHADSVTVTERQLVDLDAPVRSEH